MNRGIGCSGTDSLPEGDLSYIRTLAKQHTAISLDKSKGYLVNSRLLPMARREGYATVGELITELRSRPVGRLHMSAVEALATTETSFFRDHHPFEALREQIIPEIMRARRALRAINFWSAGCSSGQEPYSLAILLRERFPHLNGWRVQVYASDLSKDMIARARDGIYRQHEVNRGLPAHLLVRYFRQQRNRWQVRSEIQGFVHFFQHNLTHDWHTVPKVDVLFLRNVLIYFDVATRKEILAKARRAIRPDGYLLLGTAETTYNLDDSFVRERIGRSVFYRLAKGGGR